ncbi:ribonuclease HII [Rufibacter glacialis]|uniref:Ribonuclease HII n=1 Tax=Rufibacter glacialis TaxID=1259555 RepID=A0A5M8QHT9_9BACT|nr:ribonuclease HII [Rufibacter glacialis]KAA6435657.1 ribonuclease HII [Rufibacter glacialis]GGK65321.1 ribonuclease HII [Rufibacter glacialis]
MLIANHSGKLLEVGLDEAGRGCLAGPVVAGAVVLPQDYFHPLLTDSKLLTAKQREQLREEICREALFWAVAEVSPQEIDEINILNASFLAMHRATDGLAISPEYLLVDGNRFTPYKEVPHACMVKGDSRFYNIAAASVLAKTHRDQLMHDLASHFPAYKWEQNAGYPTKAHRTAIREYGVSPHHRLTFRLLPDLAALEL